MKKYMKQLICFALLLGVMLSMTAYGSAESETEKNQTDSDVLVVYFSRTGEQYNVGEIDKGNTAIVAEMIAEETGADVFEILPEEDYYPYTYAELTDVAKQEQKENARPAYAGEVPDLEQYTTVFIGSPVWWGDWPMIMYTFFEENADALAGKTLIPFSTHEGSGLSGFDSKLSSACPDSTVGEGLAIKGSDAQNEQDDVKDTVNEWLSELGF
jgi:flavodoxin